MIHSALNEQLSSRAFWLMHVASLIL